MVAAVVAAVLRLTSIVVVFDSTVVRFSLIHGLSPGLEQYEAGKETLTT